MFSAGPYTGILVLDLDTDAAGAYASMLLADLGAETVRADSGRNGNADGFRLWNRSKSVVRLDPAGGADLSEITELVRRADVVIRTVPMSEADGQGLSFPLLRAVNPRLIYCSIPPFGDGGPLADAPADDGVVAAHAGIFGDQGGWEETPVYVDLPIASYGAAILATGAIGAALYEREESGRGQMIEVSLHAGALAMQAGTAVTGPNVRSWMRDATDQRGANPVYRLYRCSDGEWLMLTCGTDTFWNKLCIALGRFEWTEDPRFVGAPWNIDPVHRPSLSSLIGEAISNRPSSHWLSLFASHDVPCDLVRTRDQFFEDPQALGSGVLESGGDEKLGQVTWMSPPVRVSEISSGPSVTARRHPGGPSASPPLSGVRVLDLTGYIAGSYATSLLADLGADVIKVESPAGDGFRMLGGSFQAWNRGKRGIVVDLSGESGRDVIYDLARSADLVAANFRPGAAARLGVDESSLRGVRSSIIYLSISGFGTAGPLSDRPAFDPLIQALTGAMHAQGTDGDPVYLRVAIADYAASLLACLGATSALFASRRRGVASTVETSLLAAGVAIQSAELIGRRDPPVDTRRWGQLGELATRRIYAAAEGHIFLSCPGDEEFAAACGALGIADLARRYPDSRARLSADYEVGRALESALSALDASDAASRLRSAGVGCAEVLHVMDFHDDPQAVACGLSVAADTAIGPIRQLGPMFRFSESPAVAVRPAPDLGEHTGEVLAEMGYPDGKIARLRAEGSIA